MPRHGLRHDRRAADQDAERGNGDLAPHRTVNLSSCAALNVRVVPPWGSNAA
jgi:hypothetical protein